MRQHPLPLNTLPLRRSSNMSKSIYWDTTSVSNALNMPSSGILKINEDDIVSRKYVPDGWSLGARGMVQTEEHKQKRFKQMHREIEIDGVLYESGKAAAEALGVGASAVCQWAAKHGSRYGIKQPTCYNQYVRRS
jgi:hypothetical protein